MANIGCGKPLKLTWNIHKYSACIELLGQGIQSSQFEIESLGPIPWCLVFYPGGYEDSNYVACLLKHCGGCLNRKIAVDLEICLKAENGAEHFHKTVFNLQFESGHTLGFDKFILYEDLSRCPFPNDVLTLQLYISRSIDAKWEKDTISLSNDLQILHDEETFYDVLIRVGKSEFKVHKPLLIARFPSLVSRIEQSYYEDSIPFVTIQDFSPAIVKEVLCFIYTGKLSETSRYNRLKLREFALKYDMGNLLRKLNWAVDECTVFTAINTNTLNHTLDLTFLCDKLEHKILTDFPLSDKDILNFQYFIFEDGMKGIRISVELSIKENSEQKYFVVAEFVGTLNCDDNISLQSYEDIICLNAFESKNGTSFSFLIDNNTLLSIADNYQFLFMICKWNLTISSNSFRTSQGILDDLTCFSDDLNELFQNAIGSDLVLVTEDGTEFKVHKAVVCARVPSIMQMFKGDTMAVNGYVHDDFKDLKVEIPDVDSITFRAILEYIYSGKKDILVINRIWELYPKLVPLYMKSCLRENVGRKNSIIFRKQRMPKSWPVIDL